MFGILESIGGAILGAIVSCITILKTLCYTKDEVDKMIADAIATSSEELKKLIDDNIHEFEDELDKETSALGEAVKEIKHDIEEIKNNNNSLHLLLKELITDVKESINRDALKNYNELRLMIDKKADNTMVQSLVETINSLNNNVVRLQTTFDVLYKQK